MPVNNIINIIQDNGLGRQIPGTDYYSGLILFNSTLPSGFGATDRIKQVYSLKQAENLGITVATHPVEHYQVSEYFRIIKKRFRDTATLFIYIADPTTPFDGSQIETLQNYTDGALKQIAVNTKLAFSSTILTDAADAADNLSNNLRPVHVLIGADTSAITDRSLLLDARALDRNFVSCVLTQDGSTGGVGSALAVSEGQSIPHLGATLGTIAIARVHENIGWVGEFDVAGTIELQQPAFGNGDLVKDEDISILNSILDKGYIFLRKIDGRPSSTYHVDSATISAADSDFAYIENVRTMNKARRLVNLAMIDQINSPIYVNATTGKISQDTIDNWITIISSALLEMAVDGEISVDQETQKLPTGSIDIDPDQNVLATSKVVITIRIVPVGSLRTIELNFGFVPKIG